MSKIVALFDYDDTLVWGDSFFPFLRFACGGVATYVALGEAVAAYGWQCARGKKPELRTFVKDRLLRRLLAGKARESLRAAAARSRAWQRFNMQTLRALQAHHAAGHVIVIASGGLDLYLPEMLKGIPYNALLCTEIGVRNGIVTGDMVKGNCVRLCKAERVAAWLAANGPFDESFGYGNYPHDVPMLKLVKHRIIVS